MNWFSGLEGICRRDVPLAEHTWYGLGGAARWYLLPRNETELGQVLRLCAEHDVPYRLLGRGANVIVRDEGFDGAVIHLEGPDWEHVTYSQGVGQALVHAGAGVDFTHLVRDSVDRGLVGLENLAGIPGSVGGIVRMNAGGKYGSIGQYVRHVRLMTTSAEVEERSVTEADFGYRRSNIGPGIVLAAGFLLKTGPREDVLTRFRRIWTEKSSNQPPVAARSAGCIFKNPPQHAAGKLIDEAGLKGHRCGGAEISTKHANFIVAYPGATTQNVLDLIEVARERVLRSAGIELELEVEIW